MRWTIGRFLVVVGFLALWEVAARLGWLDHFFFSSPWEVAGVLGEWFREGRILENLAVTITEAASGYIIGVFVGTTLGFLFAFLPRVGAVMEPFMAIMNSFPRLTLAPLFIVWFGFGMLPKIILVAAFIVFICFFNTYKGLSEVDSEVLDRARLWGASKWDLARFIYFPAAISWIIAGLRVSVGFAIIGAVVAEYIGGDSGIGYLIMQGQYRLRMREVLAGLAVLIAVAWLINIALRSFEARSLKWRPAKSE